MLLFKFGIFFFFLFPFKDGSFLQEPYSKYNFNFQQTATHITMRQKVGSVNYDSSLAKSSYETYEDGFFNQSVLRKKVSKDHLPLGWQNTCLGNVGLCTNGFTLAFWSKLEKVTSGGEHLLFASGIQSFENRLIVSVEFSTVHILHVKLRNHNSEFLIQVKTQISLWQWFHIGVSYDPNTGEANIYKNGQSIGSITNVAFRFKNGGYNLPPLILAFGNMIGSISHLLMWDFSFDKNTFQNYYLSFFLNTTCLTLDKHIVQTSCENSFDWIDSDFQTCSKHLNRVTDICPGLMSEEFKATVSLKNKLNRPNSCNGEKIYTHYENFLHECNLNNSSQSSTYYSCMYKCKCPPFVCKLTIFHDDSTSNICNLDFS